MTGILYLTLIPIFGLIYWCFPRHFYHATAPYEPETIRLLDSLSSALGSEVRRLGRIDVSSSRIQWVDFSLATVFSITEIGDSVTLGIDVPQQLKNEVKARPFAPARLQLSYSKLQDGTPLLHVGLVEFLNGEKHNLFAEALPLDRDTYEVWNRRANALRGFPSGGLSHLIRMTYFSVVTILTLGYGDIVPLSNLARFLAALEGVLGVVLVGLFLNALADKLKR